MSKTAFYTLGQFSVTSADRTYCDMGCDAICQIAGEFFIDMRVEVALVAQVVNEQHG